MTDWYRDPTNLPFTPYHLELLRKKDTDLLLCNDCVTNKMSLDGFSAIKKPVRNENSQPPSRLTGTETW